MTLRLPLVVAVVALAVLAGSLLLLSRAQDDARDTSLITGMSYLRTDPAMTVDQVARARFAPIGTSFSGGYDPAAHWFRIRLRPPANGGPVLLAVFPSFLDHVTLFGAEGGGRWEIQESGDSVPMDRRGWKAASLGFRIEPRAEGSLYYLRIRTDSTVQLFATARPMANELAHESRRMAGHAILFSVLWGTLILALLQMLYRPSLVDGLLVASMASYLAYSVFLLGYGVAAHPDWPPAAIGRMTDILYFLTAAASLGFHRALLGRMRPARGALLFTDLLIGGAVLALLAYLLGFAAQSFAANSAVVLLGTLALPAMALTARESADPPLRLIRLIYALFALLQAAAMLLNFGFIPAISLLLYAVEIQGLLNGLLVLALVVSRTWSMQRKHAAWKARLQDAEMRRAVAARSADLKDKLLNMLAHEVRNHLAIIRIAAEAGFGPGDRQQALAVTRDLETTINDCIRLAWLERGDLAVRAGNCDLVTVLLEALAETLDEDRIDLSGTEAQAILPHDGAFLGIALGAILRAADAALPPDAPIRIAITRHRPSGWRVAIAATGPARWPERWDPERDATPDGASLALAIASGMITLIEGTATFHQREDGIACQLYLPASSTSS